MGLQRQRRSNMEATRELHKPLHPQGDKEIIGQGAAPILGQKIWFV